MASSIGGSSAEQVISGAIEHAAMVGPRIEEADLDASDPDYPTSLPARFYAAIRGLDDHSGEQRLRRQAMGLLQDISTRLQQIAADTAATAEIHRSDLLVLALLYRANTARTVKASAIQRGLGFTAGGVTRRLDAMEAKQLIERVRDPADGRAWLVRLTAKGAELAARILERSDARNRRLLEEFSDAEWATMIALLRRVNGALL
ncbi:MAG: MarR family transcriptional regulator [Sphingomonadaceae bacterium]|nr:MarR family transcriptional regulator [Sphingomonadaceae bacterium]